ncbi:MAG: DUF2339 domain-containing protein [Chitinophagaceae bacterium]
MDGLILLVILIPLVYLILLLVILGKASSQQESIESLKNMLNQVRDQLYDINRQVKDLKKEEIIKPDIPKETLQATVKPEPVADTVAMVIPENEKTVVIVEKPVTEPEIIAAPVVKEEIATEQITVPEPEQEVREKFSPTWNKKTDWEKFIGENLANKIGIAVLVLGISFFVKFAIDNNWINEVGRVVIGLACGGILTSLAHYTRNTYRSFSSVLVGGGLSVFYFTIAFAFHQYQLIGQPAAFIVMVIITAFAVVLSLLYNRMELAILATIGGFITPFLVSTGQNNYVALFTYLGILNMGMLVLSWFKRWKAINSIALFFTTIIYGGWLISQAMNNNEPFPYKWALFFATLFYILFVAMNIINNLKLKIKFGAFDFILLLGINFLYYSEGIIILEYWDSGDYKGLFTAALGVVNLALAWTFFKQKKADRNFIYLLIGLTLTFISLAAPVQLKGNHITLFWAAEAVVLFWLYQRSRIILLKIASPLIVLLMFISLLMDWSQLYSNIQYLITIIANKGFITTLISGVSLLIYYNMMRKEADTLYLPGIDNKTLRDILLVGGILLVHAAGAWEIYYQFITRLPGTAIYAMYLQLYNITFITLILRIFKSSSSFTALEIVLTIAGMVFYIFNLRINYTISLEMLTAGNNSLHFIAHWISVALLTWLLYDLIVYFRKQNEKLKNYEVPFTWMAAACLIGLLSVEMHHIIMWMNYRTTSDWAYWENLYYKAGLSILWSLCSFSMMWLGMKHKFKTLRITSLTLFTVTIIKLFIFDIQNIPPGGKIAAFILLGVLLLIVSFMYQRLKKMIIDDKEKN